MRRATNIRALSQAASRVTLEREYKHVPPPQHLPQTNTQCRPTFRSVHIQPLNYILRIGHFNELRCWRLLCLHRRPRYVENQGHLRDETR